MGVQLCNFCEDTFVIGIKMLHICVYLCMYTYIHTFIYIYKVHTHTLFDSTVPFLEICVDIVEHYEIPHIWEFQRSTAYFQGFEATS